MRWLRWILTLGRLGGSANEAPTCEGLQYAPDECRLHYSAATGPLHYRATH